MDGRKYVTVIPVFSADCTVTDAGADVQPARPAADVIVIVPAASRTAILFRIIPIFLIKKFLPFFCFIREFQPTMGSDLPEQQLVHCHSYYSYT